MYIQLANWMIFLPLLLIKSQLLYLQDILQLPHVAVVNPQINSILSTYLETFEVIHSSPAIETQEDEKSFLRIIQDQLVTGMLLSKAWT